RWSPRLPAAATYWRRATPSASTTSARSSCANWRAPSARVSAVGGYGGCGGGRDVVALGGFGAKRPGGGGAAFPLAAKATAPSAVDTEAPPPVTATTTTTHPVSLPARHTWRTSGRREARLLRQAHQHAPPAEPSNTFVNACARPASTRTA